MVSFFHRGDQDIRAIRWVTVSISSKFESSQRLYNLVFGLSGGERGLWCSRWKGRHRRDIIKHYKTQYFFLRCHRFGCGNEPSVDSAGTGGTTRPAGAEGRPGRAQPDDLFVCLLQVSPYQPSLFMPIFCHCFFCQIFTAHAFKGTFTCVLSLGGNICSFWNMLPSYHCLQRRPKEELPLIKQPIIFCLGLFTLRGGKGSVKCGNHGLWTSGLHYFQAAARCPH